MRAVTPTATAAPIPMPVIQGAESRATSSRSYRQAVRLNTPGADQGPGLAPLGEADGPTRHCQVPMTHGTVSVTERASPSTLAGGTASVENVRSCDTWTTNVAGLQGPS
jgi:hypothetical protein